MFKLRLVVFGQHSPPLLVKWAEVVALRCTGSGVQRLGWTSATGFGERGHVRNAAIYLAFVHLLLL